MEADPDLIKADVAPLLKHITPDVIQDILVELDSVGLITIYTADARIYLQLTQFEKNQRNLRKDKEAPSRIPAPTTEQLRPKSVPTPELVGDKIKRREEKLREAEGGVGETSPPKEPVDNPKEPLKNEPKKPEPSNTHGERWTQAQKADLETQMQEIGERWGTRYHQRVYVWLQTNFNKKNPDAVIHCLKRLISDLLGGKKIPYPETWLNAALNGNGNHPGENGRFEAEETDREAAEHKKDFVRIADLIPEGLRAAQEG